jgi:hypothetical protein
MIEEVFQGALYGEVRNLLETRAFGSPVVGAWIYGSRVLTPESPGSDTDVLVVLRDCSEPKRVELLLQSGSLLSINLVSTKSFFAHDIVHNGGFYFTSKLLGPRDLLIGELEECRGLLAKAYANILHPWATYLLPDPAERYSLSLDQQVALLYLLLIRTSFSYLGYFARWYDNPRFPKLWKETTELLKEARFQLHLSNRLRFEADPNLTVLTVEEKLSDDQKRVLMQYLSSCFWHTFSKLRENSYLSLDAYFRKQVQRFSKLEAELSHAALDFLLVTLGVSILEP